MGNTTQVPGFQPPEIRAVAHRLVEMLDPKVIYLYNQRVGEAGKALGFKLCVVAAVADKLRAEQAAYTEIDCNIPFDLLLYSLPEWEELCEKADSFANKIYRTGTVIYGG